MTGSSTPTKTYISFNLISFPTSNILLKYLNMRTLQFHLLQLFNHCSPIVPLSLPYCLTIVHSLLLFPCFLPIFNVIINKCLGRLTQLVECHLDVVKVVGSSPIPPTIFFALMCKSFTKYLIYKAYPNKG